MNRRRFVSALALGCATIPCLLPAQAPHLEKRGEATQLIVDGKPFLMLSGELNNSSSSSLEFMKPIWPRLAAEGLNTVVTPLSWELIEPVEGTYDFALVDGLLKQAREAHEKVVFLWLASWKNGMSSYPPVWVKQDTKRFPRVERAGGVKVGILSPASDALRDADGKAFAALMEHIKQVDGNDHTVLMMQVENEVGVLGDTRDHSAAANAAFAGQAPAELTKYLKTHKDTLEPELLTLWVSHGEKTAGTWSEVFGEGYRADEIFMAWNYARFIQAVAAKGKAAYDLPMYVNTWLGGGEARPGDYPSGGPQPRVIDVWKAAGSALDIYAPDLYASDFASWCQRYHRPDNPLYMPETNGGAVGAANVFYAVGEHAALGFSPFAIDRPFHSDVAGDPFVAAVSGQSAGSGPHIPPPDLAQSYQAIGQIAPLILEAQSKGQIHGFLLDKAHPSFDFQFEGYLAHVSLDDIFGFRAEKGFGLILETGPGQFLGEGEGFRVSFSPALGSRAMGKQVGIASVDEGRFEDGQWMPGRRLNGDENDQGGYWRFDQFKVHIEKAVVYTFE
jgi:beta-galactosidase GanA